MRLLGLAAGAFMAISPAGATEIVYECTEQVEETAQSRKGKIQRQVVYILDDTHDRFSTFVPGHGVEIDWCRNTTSCTVSVKASVVDIATKWGSFKRRLHLNRATGQLEEIVTGDGSRDYRAKAACVLGDIEKIRRPDGAIVAPPVTSSDP